MTERTPTKSNLMRAQLSLQLSQKAYELLDRKRNVLIREMMNMISRARDIQDRIDETFSVAYRALQMANITMGIRAVEDIALSIPEETNFEILMKSVMGVEIPGVRFKQEGLAPHYSFFHTNNALDVALLSFQKVKYLIFELGEIENSIYRLAGEIKKTQKRTNALQNIQIPKYRELVKIIQEALDEKDREEFFRLKMVKKKKVANLQEIIHI
ncbi:MAG TPA: V-type ATP synthase subunit D [Clostridiales bacterium]|nr:V-type ATP synthase subunit D [Clostridiales bacterium]